MRVKEERSRRRVNRRRFTDASTIVRSFTGRQKLHSHLKKKKKLMTGLSANHEATGTPLPRRRAKIIRPRLK